MRIQAYTQACALSERGPEPLHEDQRAEIKVAGGVTGGLGSRASQMHGTDAGLPASTKGSQAMELLCWKC